MESVYNNLISSYLMPKTNSARKNTRVHDDKELVDHYSDIIKSSKSAPIYIVKLSDDTQEYVLGLKDMSIGLEDTIGRYYSNMDKSYNRIVVDISDDSVGADIISDEGNLPEDMDINVNAMATPQLNVGYDYYPDGRGLPGGNYEFKAEVNGREFRFRYSMKDGTRNNMVLRSVARSINQAGIGVLASVGKTDNGKINIRLESDADTGDGMKSFTFEDITSGDNENGIVSYYGFDRVFQELSEADIDINGVNYRHPGNRLVINDSMQIDINRVTDGSVHIGYKKDSSQVFDDINAILRQYNNIVDMADTYSDHTGIRSIRLKMELNGIYEANEFSLNAAGIIRDEDGHLAIDKTSAESAFQSGIFEEVFGKDSEFLNRLSAQLGRIELDPMNYVNKLMVAYPDYSREGYAHPYMTSIYSGMLFNYYC